MLIPSGGQTLQTHFSLKIGPGMGPPASEKGPWERSLPEDFATPMLGIVAGPYANLSSHVGDVAEQVAAKRAVDYDNRYSEVVRGILPGPSRPPRHADRNSALGS